MSVIQFDQFELDEQTLELRRNGQSVRIQQQPARVLAFLLKHRGTLVTREQIRLAIWGNDTFVDFEQGLNFCIRQIRLTLDDRADQPKYIETLPRLGYRFAASAESVSPEVKKSEPNRIRIAVLPVEDLNQGNDDYFATGLTEDLISALSRIDPVRLRVIAGPRLPGTIPATEQFDRLQREFKLDYLLRGTVRRSADTTRVTVQLHDLNDRSVMWSEHYDRKSADLLAVQEDITQRVSQSLALELLPEAAVGARKYSRSSTAYDAYLKGRFFWHKMTTEAIHLSLRYFNEALSIDSGFAPAHAGLADCYAQMGSIRVGMMKPFEALARARTHLERAFELDDSLAEAHCTLGLIKSWYDLDWAGAEREFKTALSLDPSHITALLWQSLYLAAMGRSTEAVESASRAKESEPLSVTTNIYLGMSLNFSGQYDLAVRQLRQAIELDPGYYRSYLFLGVTLNAAGRHEEAIALLLKARSLNRDNVEVLAYLAVSYAGAGNRSEAAGFIQEVKSASSRMEPAILLASAYAQLGDAEETFAWLRAAVERRSVPLYLGLLNRELAPYKSDPRYRTFLESLGLPQFWKGAGPRAAD
jgi:TolB-like protein/tetratricopeptide (TPR) repeat protein